MWPDPGGLVLSGQRPSCQSFSIFFFVPCQTPWTSLHRHKCKIRDDFLSLTPPCLPLAFSHRPRSADLPPYTRHTRKNNNTNNTRTLSLIRFMAERELLETTATETRRRRGPDSSPPTGSARLTRLTKNPGRDTGREEHWAKSNDISIAWFYVRSPLACQRSLA